METRSNPDNVIQAAVKTPPKTKQDWASLFATILNQHLDSIRIDFAQVIALAHHLDDALGPGKPFGGDHEMHLLAYRLWSFIQKNYKPAEPWFAAYKAISLKREDILLNMLHHAFAMDDAERADEMHRQIVAYRSVLVTKQLTARVSALDQALAAAAPALQLRPGALEKLGYRIELKPDGEFAIHAPTHPPKAFPVKAFCDTLRLLGSTKGYGADLTVDKLLKALAPHAATIQDASPLEATLIALYPPGEGKALFKLFDFEVLKKCAVGEEVREVDISPLAGTGDAPRRILLKHFAVLQRIESKPVRAKFLRGIWSALRVTWDGALANEAAALAVEASAAIGDEALMADLFVAAVRAVVETPRKAFLETWFVLLDDQLKGRILQSLIRNLNAELPEFESAYMFILEIFNHFGGHDSELLPMLHQLLDILVANWYISSAPAGSLKRAIQKVKDGAQRMALMHELSRRVRVEVRYYEIDF